MKLSLQRVRATRIAQYIARHKIISVLGAIVILGGVYMIISQLGGANGTIQYVVVKATRGTITASVTGSGQVSGSNQITVTSKASGDINAVNVVTGQAVTTGVVLAQINARDALIQLESARIALAKLKQIDSSTLLQAQNALTTAQDNRTQAYSNALGTISQVFIDVPTILSELETQLFNYSGYLYSQKVQNMNPTARAYRDIAETRFYAARDAYNTTHTQYGSLSRTSPSNDIQVAVSAAYDMTKLVADAVKQTKTTVDYIKGQFPSVTAGNSTIVDGLISSWTTTINSNISSLVSAKNAIISAEQSITEKTQSLQDTTRGADPLDIQSQELSLKQKEYAYADSFVRAPFDGVVAKVYVHKADSVSSGASIATIITKKKIATISLNEVDAVKVKVGQKATLTFDAIDGLTLDGSVVSADLVGTVSQGVVSYNAEIEFDTQDERVRSGMSVNATITTDSKDQALIIPTNAIKTQGTKSYVEIFNALDVGMLSSRSQTTITPSVAPEKRFVESGISSDMLSEVISGLEEGDIVVVRTITSSTQATQTKTPSIIPGGGSGTRIR